MKRDVLDVLSKGGNLLDRVRKITLGGALAGLGLFGTGVVVSAGPLASADHTVDTSVTIIDRSKKTAKLVLRLPGRLNELVAQHRSHSSHSSHRSHSSHVSGSGGTVAPAPPVASAAAKASGLLTESAPTTESRQLTGKFFAFDAAKKVLIVRDTTGSRFEFILQDDATLTAAGTSWRADQYLRSHFNNLPYGADQLLRISWKPAADGKGRIAVTVR